jgi:hypothetical protein
VLPRAAERYATITSRRLRTCEYDGASHAVLFDRADLALGGVKGHIVGERPRSIARGIERTEKRTANHEASTSQHFVTCAKPAPLLETTPSAKYSDLHGRFYQRLGIRGAVRHNRQALDTCGRCRLPDTSN